MCVCVYVYMIDNLSNQNCCCCCYGFNFKRKKFQHFKNQVMFNTTGICRVKFVCVCVCVCFGIKRFKQQTNDDHFPKKKKSGYHIIKLKKRKRKKGLSYVCVYVFKIQIFLKKSSNQIKINQHFANAMQSNQSYKYFMCVCLLQKDNQNSWVERERER